MLIVITAASSPEPSIRVWKNSAPLYHTERSAAEYIEGSFWSLKKLLEWRDYSHLAPFWVRSNRSHRGYRIESVTEPLKDWISIQITDYFK